MRTYAIILPLAMGAGVSGLIVSAIATGIFISRYSCELMESTHAKEHNWHQLKDDTAQQPELALAPYFVTANYRRQRYCRRAGSRYSKLRSRQYRG